MSLPNYSEFYKTTDRNIIDLYADYKEGKIVLDPKYQRDEVWKTEQKNFLIETILTGGEIPIIYTAFSIKTKGKGKKAVMNEEIIDGKQRLSTIIAFIENRFFLISSVFVRLKSNFLPKP